jgi:bifunctional enzyme CysN/CysC
MAAKLETLRFITCGSVDDGKSTLIGRLLWDTGSLPEDHVAALHTDSAAHGTQGEGLDYALLLDGLQAEREQGITIDVAYRYFRTPQRSFIVADTPGHEQYTCNMATGASGAELAVILIDARKGVLSQTRRHSRIVHMLGIQHVVVAINKMDLVAWSEEAFQRIVADYRAFAQDLDFASLNCIPLSALCGDNLITASTAAPWYSGPSLLGYLETLDTTKQDAEDFRMPVQWVNRPNLDFRGYCGRIASGSVAPGDAVRVLPSGALATIKSIVSMDGALPHAQAGQSVTLTLEQEVDISRGDVITPADLPVECADQFEVRLLWMSEKPLVAGRSYALKIHHQHAMATVTAIKYEIDIHTGAHLSTKSVTRNTIAVVNLSLNRVLPFEPYARNRTLGALILVDRLRKETVAAGMVHFALRRASNIHWHSLDLDRRAREQQKEQKACCVWFTGLSGSGKSTIANLVEKRLHASGKHTYLLDGDNLRHGINRDLGFTEADRVENIRRVAEIAKLMVDAGLVVLVSLISPYRADRDLARSLLPAGDFLEVFVDTPVAVCEQRDPKGLYAKVRAGAIKNFTGVDSPYEPPLAPELRIATVETSAQEAAETIAALLGTQPGPQ